MKGMRFALLSFLALISFLPSARADYFVWRDAQTGLMLTFPDSWKTATSAMPDTILTLLGPTADKPECRISAHEDGRYKIFPARYGEAVQRVAVSREFWRDYLNRYEGYDLGKVYDGGALGRWFASYTVVRFDRYAGTVLQPRQGIMFASLYGGTMYIAECSSLAGSFATWRPQFESIIKSIDFKAIYPPQIQGYYGDFLKGADMYFWSQTGPDGTYNQ